VTSPGSRLQRHVRNFHHAPNLGCHSWTQLRSEKTVLKKIIAFVTHALAYLGGESPWHIICTYIPSYILLEMSKLWHISILIVPIQRYSLAQALQFQASSARFFKKLSWGSALCLSAAWPNLGGLFIETFFYILRKRASFGRALQAPEQSCLKNWPQARPIGIYESTHRNPWIDLACLKTKLCVGCMVKLPNGRGNLSFREEGRPDQKKTKLCFSI
jgi:hypothetical protein